MTISETIIETAALGWPEDLGCVIKRRPEIAPGEPFSERKDYDQSVLGQRVRDVLARLNSDPPLEALDDAFRKITRPAGPTLEARNLGFPRQLVGVAL